uniref:Uncharacterized protein n=1 Tax=Anguilla anguilla TaxID=7936 RepID=A0A0E9RTB6_ANGAN
MSIYRSFFKIQNSGHC